jgi:hypothetical protein
MRASLEFLIRLLERGGACVGREDFEGPHGGALRLWQELGFLRREPWANPVPACPHCEEGVPYLLGTQYRCNRCRSAVDHRWLFLWPFDEQAFFRWLALRLELRGGTRDVDGQIWQLGTWQHGDERRECFYRRSGALSSLGRTRLAAYRNVLVLYGLDPPPREECPDGERVSLLELLGPDGPPTMGNLESFLRAGGTVRFDAERGVLWVGGQRVGEVPVGSREYFFLRCLAERIDQFVAYSDIKHEVLRQTGGRDTTEEATFCQGLKSRIKRKWIPEIDRLLTTTNKADGYRLRGHAAR